MLLDREPERDQAIKIASHLLDVRAQLAQHEIISTGQAKAVEERDVQTRS